VLLLVLGGAGARLHAQHVESAETIIVVPKSDLEKKLQYELICMCGTCGRKRIGECTCPVAADMRAEVARLAAAGKTHDEIIDYYVEKYGSQEPLASPIDEGFNRLAWLLPYALGAAGVLVIGGVAFRWSRRGTAGSPEAEPRPQANAALESRLDDELRDLD
jgi:cytochrome c-type biogenesis protein CcmH